MEKMYKVKEIAEIFRFTCQTSLALNHHVTSIEPATQNYI